LAGNKDAQDAQALLFGAFKSAIIRAPYNFRSGIFLDRKGYYHGRYQIMRNFKIGLSCFNIVDLPLGSYMTQSKAKL
jgi:hypothetical protein